MKSSEKQPYIKQAEEDKRRYEREYQTYVPSDDDDDDDDIDEIEREESGDEEEEEEEELIYDDDDDEDDDEDDYRYRKNSGGPKKKKSKKEKDPNAPKRPLNAYLIFVNQERASVVADNPKWKITEVVKYLGAQWKTLPEADKKPYNDLAAAEKDRYEREMKNYST